MPTSETAVANVVPVMGIPKEHDQMLTSSRANAEVQTLEQVSHSRWQVVFLSRSSFLHAATDWNFGSGMTRERKKVLSQKRRSGRSQ